MKKLLISLLLLVVFSVSIFFGGAVLKDKKLAFLLPLLSMLLSDLLYQVLFINGFTPIAGFYSGQVENYLLFSSLTVVGFFVNKNNASFEDMNKLIEYVKTSVEKKTGIVLEKEIKILK